MTSSSDEFARDLWLPFLAPPQDVPNNNAHKKIVKYNNRRCLFLENDNISGKIQETFAHLFHELTLELGQESVMVASDVKRDDLLKIDPSISWMSHPSTNLTRVLSAPLPISGKVARGSRVEIAHQTFVVQRVTPRKSCPDPLDKDVEHLLVWLTHGHGGVFAWISRHRRLKQALLHGWFT